MWKSILAWFAGFFSKREEPKPEAPKPEIPVIVEPKPEAKPGLVDLRAELVAYWREDLDERETHGKNRSPMIDEVNRNMSYLGAAYCIAALLWRGVRRLCLKYGLKNPVLMTASTQSFYNDSPKKYRKPKGLLGLKADIGILVNRGDSDTGHAFALTENEPATGQSPTIEYNTNGEGSSNGDGVYERHRLQSGTGSQSFRGYIDVVQWILDANPGFSGKLPTTPTTPTTAKASALYKSAQGNRGVPKAAFVDELFEIFRKLPDSAFAQNPNVDIFSVIGAELGPWLSLTHRRAAGFEAMVALAGRESSWNWNEGRDQAASNTSAETEESGAWQTSYNARNLHPQAKALVAGITGKQYIVKAKADHAFTTEFTWWVLRGSTKHHGPVARGEILPYLSRSRVAELTKLFGG